jgi:hypothetical protein
MPAIGPDDERKTKARLQTGQDQVFRLVELEVLPTAARKVIAP